MFKQLFSYWERIKTCFVSQFIWLQIRPLQPLKVTVKNKGTTDESIYHNTYYRKSIIDTGRNMTYFKQRGK